jgi:hypothetical protein
MVNSTTTVRHLDIFRCSRGPRAAVRAARWTTTSRTSGRVDTCCHPAEPAAGVDSTLGDSDRTRIGLVSDSYRTLIGLGPDDDRTLSASDYHEDSLSAPSSAQKGDRLILKYTTSGAAPTCPPEGVLRPTLHQGH